LIPNINIVKAKETVLGAHRGNSVDYIENTLPAFQDAAEQEKYKFIEFDVQYTKDKKMIVHHDETLLRLQRKNYNVKKLTYDELLNISNYHIPLYSEVMKMVAGKKPLNIEIKSQGNLSDDKIMVDYIVNDCKERGIFESTLFSSISSNVIRYLSEKYPESNRGKIYYIFQSSFLNFDFFTSQIYDEMEEIGANYLMIHSNNLRNYNSLKSVKPEDVTIVFWYLADDQMYIVNPNKDDWTFKLAGKVIYSSREKCIWWC
jgi:glycerophosphoryl diester phosphodiesterase